MKRQIGMIACSGLSASVGNTSNFDARETCLLNLVLLLRQESSAVCPLEFRTSTPSVSSSLLISMGSCKRQWLHQIRISTSTEYYAESRALTVLISVTSAPSNLTRSQEYFVHGIPIARTNLVRPNSASNETKDLYGQCIDSDL